VKLLKVLLNGPRRVIGIMFFSKRKIKNDRFYWDCDIFVETWWVCQIFLWLTIVGIILGILIPSYDILAVCLVLLLFLIFIITTTKDLDVRKLYTSESKSKNLKV
jgi:hypothetical protein